MLHGYVIKPGDKISWRQFQSATARGGIVVETSSGGETVWSLQDQNGSFINSGSVTGQWDDRTADLSGLAGGAISLMGVGLDTATTGSATIQFADMAIFSTDGTVTPIFNGGSAAFTRGFGNNSMANAQASVGSYPASAAATHFFIGDHLGTAQMEFAAGGWPVWQGQFAPYGQELDSQTTSNHYKFTGKERDTESGLDYFGARYYASSMGRFMSPDWSAKAEPVPYSKLDNPQSLNLYAYVLNNPLSRADLDGHNPFTDWVKQTAHDVVTLAKSTGFSLQAGAGLSVKGNLGAVAGKAGFNIHGEFHADGAPQAFNVKAEVGASVGLTGGGAAATIGPQASVSAPVQSDGSLGAPTANVQTLKPELGNETTGLSATGDSDRLAIGASAYAVLGGGAEVSVSRSAFDAIGNDVIKAVDAVTPAWVKVPSSDPKPPQL